MELPMQMLLPVTSALSKRKTMFTLKGKGARYTHGGAGRTGNHRAAGLASYTDGHRGPIRGHTMRTHKVHGHGRKI